MVTALMEKSHFSNAIDFINQCTFFLEISDVQEKTMKYDCPQCDNVYYEKKEWSEHIEEVNVKQEKGNRQTIKILFIFLLHDKKEKPGEHSYIT